MIKEFFNFIKLLLEQKYLIWTMAKREVQTQHIGSFLGFVWTFIQPLVMIAIFWTVFEVGFKVKSENQVPYIAWLTAGMAAWLAFSEIITGSCGIVIAHRNLIKKTVFQAHILPVVKILASMITHGVFLIILLLIILYHGMPFSPFYFQSLYYLACMLTLALGLSWILSSLSVFLKDVIQIVNVVVQAAFWATPIMWNLKIMPEDLQTVFKLNPMWYVVQGYRESFLYFVPFWQHPYQTLYFWTIAAIMLLTGALVFRRLKPQFADVL